MICHICRFMNEFHVPGCDIWYCSRCLELGQPYNDRRIKLEKEYDKQLNLIDQEWREAMKECNNG